MVKGVRFMISEGEDFTLGPKTQLQSFRALGGKFYSSGKGLENRSDIDIGRGCRVPHLLVLSRPYVLFQLVTDNRKVLPDPLPQHTYP